MKPFSLEIHFPVSRSKNYREIVKRARLFSGFTENPNILKITDIDELFGRWDDFSIVLHNSTKWVGTTLYFDGSAILPYSNRIFYALQEMKECYRFYKEEFDKESFCSHSDWGCKLISLFPRNLTSYGFNWYKSGKFEGKDWIVNKERIYSIILEEARIRTLLHCPVFRLERLKQSIDSLPGKIILDENWEIECESMLTEKGIEQVPVNINFIEKEIPRQIRAGLIPRFKEDPEVEPEQETEEQKADRLINEYLKKKKEQDKPTKWEDEPF